MLPALRDAAARRVGAVPKSELPRHIAVLCDGNRRWARDAGHDDVSYGYRVRRSKIAEMLRWCQDAGIEMATVYLLSTGEPAARYRGAVLLIEIITDVVRGDLRAGEPVETRARSVTWNCSARSRPVGCATPWSSTNGRRCRFHVQRRCRLRRTAGDRRRVRAARQELANGATGRAAGRVPSPPTRISRTCTPPGRPDPDLGHPYVGRAAACPASCCGRAPIRRCGSPRRYWPGVPAGGLSARAAGLHRAAPPLRALIGSRRWAAERHARLVSHGCAVSGGVRRSAGGSGLYLLARDPRKPVLALAAIGLVRVSRQWWRSTPRAAVVVGRMGSPASRSISVAVPGVAWFAVLLELSRPLRHLAQPGR